MCQFFESIKILGGKPVNIDLHENRMNRTRSECLGSKFNISLSPLLQTDNPSLQKCRVFYDDQIKKIEFLEYIPKQICYLRMIEADGIQYPYKYADRRCFENLQKNLSPQTELLFVKNEKITDTSFSNVVFWDGTSWFTPAEPLLEGTKREFLLLEGIIKPAEIRKRDLHLFRYAKMINAMLDLEFASAIAIGNII